MAMELEFWVPDGAGEVMERSIRVAAWEILRVVETMKTHKTAYIILRRTSRQRGSWIIWVRKGYWSSTDPVVGPLEEYTMGN